VKAHHGSLIDFIKRRMGIPKGCNRAIPRIRATQKLASCKGKSIVYEVLIEMALNWE